MRLRSPATLVALAAVFVGSVLWIPDPKGNASSLSWRLPDGRVQAPLYDTAYVGFAASAVACIAITLVGFYLVAGSVRRDRERGVGAILAATPLSNAEYLIGKFVAHCAYLAVVLGLALLAALTAWMRFGAGRFSAGDLLALFLLLSLPAVAVTASSAIFFDVVPGLSGRGGSVAWFFAFSLLLVAVPMEESGGGGEGSGLRRMPVVDPAGAATQAFLARQTVAGAAGFATGLEIRDTPFERVPWRGVAITPKLAVARAANLLVALLPLAPAILLFDRFDPARRRRRASSGSSRIGRWRGRADSDAPEPAAAPRHLALEPAAARPSAGRAVLAEARLIWNASGWLRWPLLASAVLAGALPAPAAAIFLLLLVPAVSEAAARESVNGTSGLVFSQPGVPASPVLWKAASVCLFLLVLAAPLVGREFLQSPVRGLAAAAGIGFVALSAVGLGFLTAGGKLFTGAYLVLWYLAVSNLPQADFAAVLGKAPVPRYAAAYLLIGVFLLAAAALKERYLPA